jgi:ABC-type Zn uptake system ZnuABC Zn-binding protein ZnuA
VRVALTTDENGAGRRGDPADRDRRPAEPPLLARPEPRGPALPAEDHGQALGAGSCRRHGLRSNAAAYARELEQLDGDLQATVAELPADQRKLVTFHDAFPYFARHFGFELVGVIVANVGQDPSAGELVALVDKIRAAGVKAVFSEAQFSPKLAETLAQEAGVERVVTTLYNDTLGTAPADTYVGMMRWNVDQVVNALR